MNPEIWRLAVRWRVIKKKLRQPGIYVVFIFPFSFNFFISRYRDGRDLSQDPDYGKRIEFKPLDDERLKWQLVIEDAMLRYSDSYRIDTLTTLLFWSDVGDYACVHNGEKAKTIVRGMFV